MKLINSGNMLSSQEQAKLDKEKIKSLKKSKLKVKPKTKKIKNIEAGVPNPCVFGVQNHKFNEKSI